MKEIILSVGIDIGTSTTQLIFSRLTIENQASSYTVPKISIVDKKVIYKSPIYFTPLLSTTSIDAEGVKAIVEKEYKAAGMKPEELHTGAVIITGETARKENAASVLETLSALAGDFVVATAGPNLESVLSAKGAGTDKLSEEKRIPLVNLDIGGGTSNLAIFEKGKLKGTTCLDIGGRLIKIEQGKIQYVYSKIGTLAKHHNIELHVGDIADKTKLKLICKLMADQLAKAIYLKNQDEEHLQFYTNNGEPLPKEPQIQGVTFSGGVADYIYNATDEDVFRYGDIGILLGQAVIEHPAFTNIKIYQAAETIRATVVGAGTHTTDVSGSTIAYVKEQLPIKNIPILKISIEDEQELDKITKSIADQLPLFTTDKTIQQIAIALSGQFYTSFNDIQLLAAAIIAGADIIIKSKYPLVVILENDIGKVLGNTMNMLLERRKDVICLDGIYAGSGDYIDIGEPIANGRVVPIVTKTLIFNT